MRLQHQTTFGGVDAPLAERGNCYATCIASLLAVDVKDVPNFCARHESWYEDTNRWLASWGLAVLCFPFDPFLTVPEQRQDIILIASGPGPRGHRHSVLWRGGRLFHDPHPSSLGLLSADEFDLLVVADPDRLADRLGRGDAA